MAKIPQITGITTKDTIVLTGNVYDLYKASFATGVTITVCIFQSGEGLEPDTFTTIKSAIVDKQGTYYIVLSEKDVPDDAFTLSFCAFQSGYQLEMEKQIKLEFNSFTNKQILQDISLYSLPQRKVKGKLKRKNNMPAAGCCVELLSAEDDTILGSTITDTKGDYEIAYLLTEDTGGIGAKKQKSLYLKFYNNEDIEDSLSSSQLSINPTTYSSSEYPVQKNAVSGDAINDLIIERNASDGKEYYYIVANNNGTLRRNLIYIKDELPKAKKEYWRIMNNKKILDKRILFEDEANDDLKAGKTRIVYTKTENGEKPCLTGKILLRQNTESLPRTDEKEPPFKIEETNYISEIETYKASSSPVLISSKEIEEINFKFTKDSLDLYTRLTNRETEYKNIIEGQYAL